MKIDSIEEFFLETHLYEKLNFDKSYGNILFQIIYFTGKIDCYCPLCKKESTFIGTNKAPEFNGFSTTSIADLSVVGGMVYFLNKIHSINFYCSRVEKHKMQQIVYLTENQIFKIGQYPSIAEISQPDLKNIEQC